MEVELMLHEKWSKIGCNLVGIDNDTSGTSGQDTELPVVGWKKHGMYAIHFCEE